MKLSCIKCSSKEDLQQIIYYIKIRKTKDSKAIVSLNTFEKYKFTITMQRHKNLKIL